MFESQDFHLACGLLNARHPQESSKKWLSTKKRCVFLPLRLLESFLHQDSKNSRSSNATKLCLGVIDFAKRPPWWIAYPPGERSHIQPLGKGKSATQT